ncbi:MAG: Lrp/AsnC family transcriptional regulator [Paracoccaceae bacterium]
MIDNMDKALLAAVQRDSQLTAQDLGELLNLSPSQAARRRQKLESEGYISGYRAHINAEKLGLQVQAFIQVQLSTHGPKQGRAFSRMLSTRPEIVAAWTLTGEADYMLRVFCSDLKALNVLVQDILLPLPMVLRVQSRIVMDQIKADAPLPTQ